MILQGVLIVCIILMQTIKTPPRITIPSTLESFELFKVKLNEEKRI